MCGGRWTMPVRDALCVLWIALCVRCCAPSGCKGRGRDTGGVVLSVLRSRLTKLCPFGVAPHLPSAVSHFPPVIYHISATLAHSGTPEGRR